MNSPLHEMAPGAAVEEFFEQRAAYERLLQDVAKRRRNLLVHGEAGAGKTRLLRRFAQEQARAAYVSLAHPLRDVMLHLLKETAGVGKLETVAAQSMTTLKGLLEKRLAAEEWILVLDQVEKPGANVGKMVKDLHGYGRTPILFAGRSAHMEDIGSFRSMCLERPSRLELKAWEEPVALAFAQREADELKLVAANLDEALRGIAKLSGGYPGRIVEMLRMAASGKYSHDGSIKFHTVYLDSIMGSH